MDKTTKPPKLPKGWSISSVEAVSPDGRMRISFGEPKGLSMDDATKRIVKMVKVLK
jgi:hypothetical protein